MLAHIIHSQNRPERLENIVKQSEEQGFEFRLWDAVPHNNPVTGCTLAHKQIVKWAKIMQQLCVWIMEDDCMFTDKGAAQEFIERIPMFYEIYLGGMHGTHKFWSTEDVNSFMYPKTFSGTHCYILNASAYDAFLAMPENVYIDVAISRLYPEDTVSIVLPNPMYAIQMPGHSDIVNRVVDYTTDQHLWQYKLYKHIEELDFELTDEWKDQWRKLGTKYGYPACCIESFVARGLEEPLFSQRTAGDGTGFIPCSAHAKQVLRKEITLESLIINRTATTLFPNSES